MISFLLHHLPLLLIIIPLIAAAISSLIHHKYLVWLFSFITTGICFGLSILQFLIVDQDIFLNYSLGNWPAPWGIELAVDYLNAFVLLIVTAAGVLCCLHGKATVQSEITNQQTHLFYTAYLLNLTGLTGVLLTGDAFNLFVFVEISAISSYALVALGKHRDALFSAYRYLIFGTIGATFILIGLGFLYVMTGTLNMQDLAEHLATSEQNRTIITGMSFIIIGTCLKLALFPFHIWLPSVYQHSPFVVTIFFSATTTKVFIYVLLRYLQAIFDDGFFLENIVGYLLFILSLLAIVYGSIKAISADYIKSVFAYSSIAQIGYMVLAIALLNQSGIIAVMVYMFNHAMIKAAIFIGLACIAWQYQIEKINDLKGMFQHMPLTCIAILIACLALIGLPTTAGFISKWLLILAVLEQQSWISLLVIILGSLMSIVYVWKIVEVMYFEKTQYDSVNKQALPVTMVLPLWILIAMIVYFGLNSSIIYGFSEDVASYLFYKER